MSDHVLLTIAEAARRLSIGETLLRERLGEFPLVRIGRRVLIPAKAIETWVEAHTERPVAAGLAVVAGRTAENARISASGQRIA